ncbi:hypothetical protein ACVIHC_001559 [Bradyrhizobium diazoefficiens]
MSVAKIVSALQICPGGRALDAPPQRDPAPSLQSRCFNVLLRLLPFKKQLASRRGGAGACAQARLAAGLA